MPRFEPDQLVLVRENDAARWRLTHYSHTVEGMDWNVTIDGKVWASPFIIPYAGNEHLLGTTESITPKWEPKPGELVAVRHSRSAEWVARIFNMKDPMDPEFPFSCFKEQSGEKTGWRYCEPLRSHFNIPEK